MLTNLYICCTASWKWKCMFIELRAEILAMHKFTDLMMIRNLQKSLGFCLCSWLFSVSKSKVMTQICTCEVKCEVLFWSFKSCPLCWVVLFFTSVTLASTKKITHTHQYSHLSLYSCLCVTTHQEWRGEHEHVFVINVWVLIIIKVTEHELDWMLDDGQKVLIFYQNSFYQRDDFLHSYRWWVMAGTIKTICYIFW
jgi:hypothetical protein